MKLRECLKDLVPYVPGKLKAGAIKLASNENPLGVSPKARDAMIACASKMSIYPDGGTVRLRSTLSEKLGVSPEQIIVGNGSDEVLVFIGGAYISAGDNAVTSMSTFSEYTFATRLFGGEIRYSPMVNGTFQLDAMLKLIDSRTKLVFVCNPNNPTGTYIDEAELVDFIEKVPSDVLVVLDEAYDEYVNPTRGVKSIALLNRFPNIIILRTFSKIYGLGGLRVGYGIASTAVIADLQKTREPFNVNAMAQEAAVAALEDDAFVAQSLSVNEAGKAFLYAAFDRLGLSYWKTEANFIFVNIGIDCIEAFETLMEMGVTIRPMKGFGFPQAIRITVGTAEQNAFFVDCLERILKR